MAISFCLAVAGAALAGCGILTGQPEPPPPATLPAPPSTTTPRQPPTATRTPTSTSSIATPSPTITVGASATALPARPTVLPTLPASPTAAPGLPDAEIQILSPGPLSRVASPILARAFMAPGANGRVQVELLGEDGRLLVRQVLAFGTAPGLRINLSIELEFEIAGVAESGRLQFSAADRFGRTTRLGSVDLILLSVGETDLNPPGDLLAPIVIEEPRTGVLIQGSDVEVSGLARSASDQPLVIELIDPGGRILATRLVDLEEGEQGAHRPFSTRVPYAVGETTPALLLIHERGGRIPGDRQLASREVILGP